MALETPDGRLTSAEVPPYLGELIRESQPKTIFRAVERFRTRESLVEFFNRPSPMISAGQWLGFGTLIFFAGISTRFIAGSERSLLNLFGTVLVGGGVLVWVLVRVYEESFPDPMSSELQRLGYQDWAVLNLKVAIRRCAMYPHQFEGWQKLTNDWVEIQNRIIRQLWHIFQQMPSDDLRLDMGEAYATWLQSLGSPERDGDDIDQRPEEIEFFNHHTSTPVQDVAFELIKLFERAQRTSLEVSEILYENPDPQIQSHAFEKLKDSNADTTEAIDTLTERLPSEYVWSEPQPARVVSD